MKNPPSQPTGQVTGSSDIRWVKIPRVLLTAAVPDMVVRVYALVVDLQRHNGRCYARVGHLAELLGVSRQTVQDALRWLHAEDADGDSWLTAETGPGSTVVRRLGARDKDGMYVLVPGGIAEITTAREFRAYATLTTDHCFNKSVAYAAVAKNLRTGADCRPAERKAAISTIDGLIGKGLTERRPGVGRTFRFPLRTAPEGAFLPQKARSAELVRHPDEATPTETYRTAQATPDARLRRHPDARLSCHIGSTSSLRKYQTPGGANSAAEAASSSACVSKTSCSSVTRAKSNEPADHEPCTHCGCHGGHDEGARKRADDAPQAAPPTSSPAKPKPPAQPGAPRNRDRADVQVVLGALGERMNQPDVTPYHRRIGIPDTIAAVLDGYAGTFERPSGPQLAHRLPILMANAGYVRHLHSWLKSCLHLRPGRCPDPDCENGYLFHRQQPCQHPTHFKNKSPAPRSNSRDSKPTDDTNAPTRDDDPHGASTEPPLTKTPALPPWCGICMAPHYRWRENADRDPVQCPECNTNSPAFKRRDHDHQLLGDQL